MNIVNFDIVTSFETVTIQPFWIIACSAGYNRSKEAGWTRKRSEFRAIHALDFRDKPKRRDGTSSGTGHMRSRSRCQGDIITTYFASYLGGFFERAAYICCILILGTRLGARLIKFTSISESYTYFTCPPTEASKCNLKVPNMICQM